MPGATVHDAVTVAAISFVNGVYWHIQPHQHVAAAFWFTGTFLVAGYACAGDLDVKSREHRAWGPLRIIWLPYRVLVPHRSWIAHGMVTGGLIRTAYLACAITAILVVAVWGVDLLGQHFGPAAITAGLWRHAVTAIYNHTASALAAFAGFIAAGALHSFTDLLGSAVKPRARTQSRRRSAQ
jgi:uncharacterized metal-binding protein